MVSDSTMLVQIDRYENHVAQGRLLNLSIDRKYEFTGLDQMLLIMTDIMDTIKSPQPFYSRRNIFGEDFWLVRPSEEDRLKERCAEEDASMTATFVIKVFYRQHGDLQGELLYMQDRKKQKVSYRGSIELTRLIHELLNYLNTQEL